MITQIKLKFGSNPSGTPLTFDPGHMTVIVGPNFSGKSKLIREIQHAVVHGRSASDNVILDDLTLSPVEECNVDALIEAVRLEPNIGEVVNSEEIIVGRLGHRNKVPRDYLRRGLLEFNDLRPSDGRRHHIAQWYYAGMVRMLNAEGRIALTNDQPMGDLSQSPQSTLQLLFSNDELRKMVREIVYDAFGLHLVVDPTNGGQLRLRVSSRAPADPEEERSLSQRAVDFHKAATLLSHASDGTRAFCGILIEVMAGNPDLLLLDEPEAFLHPGLSYKLGLEMARQIQNTDKNIIVSTHSANFLMGCVSSGITVNVVRLTYKKGEATARLLSASELRMLMRNPLLRSANVLSGLFYQNVVICEADADRAFYQEINHRLNAVGRGLSNALFINANGKGAIPTIMRPLKELGVSVAAIYDLDFIKDGGSVFTSRVNACGMPIELHSTVQTSKDKLKDIFSSKDADFKTRGGVALLEQTELAVFDNLKSVLEDYGVFLVPVGEVEGWLSDRGISGHGPSWLIQMFESLGDEDSSAYVKPSDDDVWKFLDAVAARLK